MLVTPSTTFGIAGCILSYDEETLYHKPMPSELMKRALAAGAGPVGEQIRLIEARQRGVVNPSAGLIIDYKNSQGMQINYNIDSSFKDGSVFYTGLMKSSEKLWKVKESSNFMGEFRVDIFDQAGFLRYAIKNIRCLQVEELRVFINHNMEIGSKGFCGIGATPPDITKRFPDMVVTHPARDRYHIVEGAEAGHEVVAEIDRHGQAGFTCRVASGMDVALCLTVGWIIDRVRCRFDLAGTRWRSHSGNVFYKGKINWKPPPAVSLTDRGGLKAHG